MLGTTIAVAVALAMDAFAVAIGTGATMQKVGARQTFRMSWHFGVFQALMPVVGWSLGWAVRDAIEAYDHWLAFALLAFVGGRMILEAFQEPAGKPRKDPTRGAALIMLSIATSIDALAVGLSMAVLDLSIWLPAAIIGVVAAGFTAAGLHIGVWVARARRLSRYAGVLGGLVLLGIGLKILLQHGALDGPWPQ